MQTDVVNPASSVGPEIRLLVEHEAGGWSELPIPAGPPSVLLAEADRFTLEPASPRNSSAGVVLEVVQGRPPRLLAISLRHRLHVNGFPSPLAVVLGTKNAFRMETADMVFHLTGFHRGEIGSSRSFSGLAGENR